MFNWIFFKMENIETTLIIENERDRVTLAWIKKQVSDASIEAAVQTLGGRKPYISNLCKVLKITPPEDITLTPRDVALEHLKALKQMLEKKKTS
jgi:hypothetical protein